MLVGCFGGRVEVTGKEGGLTGAAGAGLPLAPAGAAKTGAAMRRARNAWMRRILVVWLLVVWVLIEDEEIGKVR